MKYAVITFFSLLLPGAVLAAPGDIDFSKGCRTNPSLTGPCFRVHGRLTGYNGTPGLRIWVIGTHRLLGVLNDEDTDATVLPLPKSISGVNLGGTDSVYCDFEVCPFENEKPGVMRPVCIEAVSNFVVKSTR